MLLTKPLIQLGSMALMLALMSSDLFAGVRCHSNRKCQKIISGSNNIPERECCLRPDGVAFDGSGGIETCYECIVIGWKQATTYAVFNQQNRVAAVTLLKGSAASQFFYTVSVNPSEGFVGLDSGEEQLQYNGNNFPAYYPLTAPLQPLGYVNLTLESFSHLTNGILYIDPGRDQQTTYFVIPEVRFNETNYLFELEIENAMVCLFLAEDSVPADARLTFTVPVTIDTQQGATIHEKFRFENARMACRDLFPLRNEHSSMTLSIDSESQSGYYHVGEPGQTDVQFPCVDSGSGSGPCEDLSNDDRPAESPMLTESDDHNNKADLDLTWIYVTVPVLLFSGGVIASIIGCATLYIKKTRKALNP